MKRRLAEVKTDFKTQKIIKLLANIKKKLYLCKNNFYTLFGTVSAKRRRTQTIRNEELGATASLRLNEKEKHEKSNSHKNQRLWPAMVRQEQIHWVKLRYGVQRTDSGAEKERCPSRGIAFVFKEPLAMFPAAKHLRSHISWCLSCDGTRNPAAKIVFFVIG